MVLVRRGTAIVLLGCLILAGCRQPVRGLSREQAYQRAERLTLLGKRLFHDPALSGSGKLSCASCHDPKHAFAPSNNLPVQRGGKSMTHFGTRAVPSLKYLQVAPFFSERYFDSDERGDDSVNNGPTGGLNWDGRVDRGRNQALIPLLSINEMANDHPTQIVAAVLKADYAGELKNLAGAAVFETILAALEAYQQDYHAFYPYTSKYDSWLSGKTTLTEQESRGLSLFNRQDKGNCAVCHISERGANGTPPQFTDYGFVALGLPRNHEIPANADPKYFDLGLCGPMRTDLSGKPEYCGLFRTPSLRNTAARGSFFHNGVFHNLKDAVSFYAQRDTNPERWYPRGQDGRIQKFNDLPAKYAPNVNREPPFGGRPGQRPPLSEGEVEDIVAFLQTLTDGYIN